MSNSRVIDEIRILLDASFSGLIINGFGFGIYTVILGQAIWKLHRKGNKALYSTALILLWIASFVGFGSGWAKFRAGFVAHNNSPIDIFEGSLAGSDLVEDSAGVVIALIADGILIWRCHTLWNNRFILISLLMLYVATAAFYILVVAVTRDPFTVLASFIGNVASASTTVSATLLIVSKIVLVTRKSHMRHSYTKVIEILVESGALVSAFMLTVAVLQLVSFCRPFDLGTTSGRTLTQLTMYISAMKASIIGIGPTLIAFRVAEEPPQTEVNATRSNRLSRLTFQRTARGTTADTQTRDPHVSTIRFMSAQEEENINSFHESADMQAHDHNLDVQEQVKRDYVQKVNRLVGTESV